MKYFETYAAAFNQNECKAQTQGFCVENEAINFYFAELFRKGSSPPTLCRTISVGKKVMELGGYARPEKRGIINPLHLFPLLLCSLTLGPGHIQYNRRQFS